MLAVQLHEQVACAKRELAMRERVYKRWVESGKMTEKKAAHETAAMAAIVETLQRLEQAERLI